MNNTPLAFRLETDHSHVFFEETALNSETCRQQLQLSSTCHDSQQTSLHLKTEEEEDETLKQGLL